MHSRSLTILEIRCSNSEIPFTMWICLKTFSGFRFTTQEKVSLSGKGFLYEAEVIRHFRIVQRGNIEGPSNKSYSTFQIPDTQKKNGKGYQKGRGHLGPGFFLKMNLGSRGQQRGFRQLCENAGEHWKSCLQEKKRRKIGLVLIQHFALHFRHCHKVFCAS